MKSEPSFKALQNKVEPATLDDLSDVVRNSSQIRILGSDCHRSWRIEEEIPEEFIHISMSKLNKLIQIEPQDQVVIVQTGAKVKDVNDSLRQQGQCIPWLPYEADDDPTIGGAISLALPHLSESECGSWRDWVLGLTLMRPDGKTAKCGSAAVKNVAGYDLPRFLVGSRGYLGILTEAILKTYPIKALPPEKEQISDSVTKNQFRWIQRVKRSDLFNITANTHQLIDKDSATLYAVSESEIDLKRFKGDWVIRAGYGIRNLDPVNNLQEKLTQRAKLNLDPSYKFEPKAFGNVSNHEEK